MRNEGRKGGPEPVGRVLVGLLERLGLQQRLAERRLLEAWPQIVGEKIARHSRAVDLADGVLVLRADHGAWRQELTLLLPQIMARYNERFGAGTVREVRWDRQAPWFRRRDNRG
jgi:predicted nucleic acid-binding Zn ribbon protein